MPHRFSDGRVPWPDGLYWSDFFRYARDEAERTAQESRRIQAAAWYQTQRAGRDAASVANRAIGRIFSPKRPQMVSSSGGR